MIAGTRLDALRARMSAEGSPAFLVSRIPNVVYLTGAGSALDADARASALVTSRDAWLLTDFRYAEAVRGCVEGSGWEVVEVAGPFWDSVPGLVGSSGLAVEDRLALGSHRSLQAALGREVTVAVGWVEALRVVKEPAEIDRIGRAAQLTDAAMLFAAETLRAGLSERDAALQIEFWMRRQGSEGVAFAPIVASGPNSARPHAIPGGRELAAGDLVIVDIGARVDGYCADLTRTFVVGGASGRAVELHAAVLDAQAGALAAIRAGMEARAADAAARSRLEAAGLGEAFGHGLGHGVGLEVHEAPTLGPRSEETVQSGSVVTVEPGAYVSGYGGVRIEDLAVVADDGVRVLGELPRDLVAVG